MMIGRKLRRVKLAITPTYSPTELDEVLAKEGRTQGIAAVMQLIDEQVVDLQHAAGAPDLSEPYTKWLLGGAEAMLSLKADITERTDEGSGTV